MQKLLALAMITFIHHLSFSLISNKHSQINPSNPAGLFITTSDQYALNLEKISYSIHLIGFCFN